MVLLGNRIQFYKNFKEFTIAKLAIMKCTNFKIQKKPPLK